MCALGNLAPSNAEEAKALAPSLDLPVETQTREDVRARRCRGGARGSRRAAHGSRRNALTRAARGQEPPKPRIPPSDEAIDAMLNDMVRLTCVATAMCARLVHDLNHRCRPGVQATYRSA